MTAIFIQQAGSIISAGTFAPVHVLRYWQVNSQSVRIRPWNLVKRCTSVYHRFNLSHRDIEDLVINGGRVNIQLFGGLTGTWTPDKRIMRQWNWRSILWVSWRVLTRLIWLYTSIPPTPNLFRTLLGSVGSPNLASGRFQTGFSDRTPNYKYK